MSDKHTFLEELEEEGKEYLNNLISKEKLDKTRLLDRIQSEFNKVDNIKDPVAFLKYVIRKTDLSAYKKEKQDNSSIGFNTDAWIQKWSDDGFIGSHVDQLVIIRTLEHLLYDRDVEIDDILDLKQKVEKYCIDNQKMNLSDVAEFIFKSKLARSNKLDEAAIRLEANKDADLYRKFCEIKESDNDDPFNWLPLSEEQMNKLKEADGERLQDS